ncbi:MAG: hypothetical protein OK474_06340 [Thaumarchaeota archaeon]|nr:hypothetical protein [Nitrososphaerota archaeon]
MKARILDEPMVMDSSGHVAVPEGPGLGVSIDEDALRKYTI